MKTRKPDEKNDKITFYSQPVSFFLLITVLYSIPLFCLFHSTPCTLFHSHQFVIYSFHRPLRLSFHRPRRLSFHRPIILSFHKPLRLSFHRPILLLFHRPLRFSFRWPRRLSFHSFLLILSHILICYSIHFFWFLFVFPWLLTPLFPHWFDYLFLSKDRNIESRTETHLYFLFSILFNNKIKCCHISSQICSFRENFS